MERFGKRLNGYRVRSLQDNTSTWFPSCACEMSPGQGQRQCRLPSNYCPAMPEQVLGFDSYNLSSLFVLSANTVPAAETLRSPPFAVNGRINDTYCSSCELKGSSSWSFVSRKSCRKFPRMENVKPNQLMASAVLKMG